MPGGGSQQPVTKKKEGNLTTKEKICDPRASGVKELHEQECPSVPLAPVFPREFIDYKTSMITD